ncbi:MAG: type II toxin-antitoxin system Phd/YefM family antitoxin [Gammaproteobacteria bacterium]
MRTFTASDAKNNFGQLLDSAQKEPVSIQKKGRSVAVLLSNEEYERLEHAEDLYWVLRSEQDSQSGFLSEKESQEFLDSI